MTGMFLFVLLSMLLAVTGVAAAVYLRDGDLPDSLSAIVYELPRRTQWLWSAWLAAVAVLLLPPLFGTMAEDAAFIGFLCVVCVIGAAVTPIVQQDTRHWHNILGIAAGLLSQLCVALLCPWVLILWAPVAVAMMSSMVGYADNDDTAFGGKGVFVLEVTCAVAIYVALAVL